MTAPADLLPIGEIARSAGVAVSTVRYYDEIGLVSATTRVGGKRRFHPSARRRVSFIRRAQEAGLALEEIRTLLSEPRSVSRDLVEDKMTELLHRRERLDVMIKLLKEFQQCGCTSIATCPDGLGQGAHRRKARANHPFSDPTSRSGKSLATDETVSRS